MKKKIAVFTALLLLIAGLFSFNGFDSIQALALQDDALQKTDTPVFERVDVTSGVVTASLLNIRQGASTSFPVIGTLVKGSEVEILGKVGNWYAIYDPEEGIIGMCSASYLDVSGKTPANNDISDDSVQTVKQSPDSQTALNPAANSDENNKNAQNTNGDSLNNVVNTGTKVPKMSADEQKLLNLVNEARREAGVEPLTIDADLLEVARLKAKDMVENEYFTHQSPVYGSPFDMMRQFDISFKTAGENIAGNETVEGAFNAWMNSPDHRKNILNANFQYIGIGVSEGSPYGKIIVEHFIGK